MVHCPKEIYQTSLLHLTVCITYRAALLQKWSDGKNNCQREATYCNSPTFWNDFTSNDINPRICIIEKTKKLLFFNFFRKNTPNFIQELNDDFPEDFFEVLHIFVGPKIKILENRPNFLNFSAKTHNCL